MAKDTTAHTEVILNDEQAVNRSLYSDICHIIDETRQQLAVAYTNCQLLMYWSIGTRVNRDVLGGKRADYGEQIVSTLSTQLQQQYGDEYAVRNLRRMMQFANEVDYQIVSTLSTQLTWSHVIEILPLKEQLQREFYLTMASSYKWSVRTLRKEIDGSLYQRTAIDLKTTRFHHEYKSQMELYLSWLDKNEREDGELPSLGLILCTEGGEEQIRYLEMDKTGIRVANYYTELPEPEKLQQIIQRQMLLAKQRQ